MAVRLVTSPTKAKAAPSDGDSAHPAAAAHRNSVTKLGNATTTRPADGTKTSSHTRS